MRALTGASEHSGGGVRDGGSGVPTLQRRELCTQGTVLFCPEHAALRRVVKRGIQGTRSCPQPVSVSASPLPTPESSPSHRGGCAHGPEVQVAHPRRHTFRSKAHLYPGVSGRSGGGASHSPLGLQCFVILSQACHSWPTLHSRHLDRAAEGPQAV